LVIPSIDGYRDIFSGSLFWAMTHYEVAFKLQHDCPYNAFSTKYPSVVISHWCNWSRDVLEIAYRDLGNQAIIKSIRELISQLGTKVIRRSQAMSNLQVVLQHCACDKLPPPTLPVIERRNCLEIQPVVYTAGWEWYRVVAFSERDLRSLFKDLDRHCKVEITSKRAISDESVRETFPVSTATLLGKLTSRQLQALVVALDSGYYDIPRTATAGEIAQKLRVPRTSYVDHLRKGENKVLQGIGPYLRLRPSET